MEHAPILPASASPAPFAAIPLPVEVQSALALHGLRELLFAPIPVLAEALAHLDKEQLGQAIEVMIAMLDATDGDPDVEADDRGGETIAIVADDEAPPEDGEEDPDLEQTRDEDDWFDHGANGPGCPLADPDSGIEDDPLGCDPEEDFGAEEKGEEDPADWGITPDYGMDQTEPLPFGFTVSSDRDALRPHRNRIREESCVPVQRRWRDLYSNEVRSNVEGYRLIVPPIAPTRRQLFKRKRGVPRQPRP